MKSRFMNDDKRGKKKRTKNVSPIFNVLCFCLRWVLCECCFAFSHSKSALDCHFISVCAWMQLEAELMMTPLKKCMREASVQPMRDISFFLFYFFRHVNASISSHSWSWCMHWCHPLTVVSFSVSWERNHLTALHASSCVLQCTIESHRSHFALKMTAAKSNRFFALAFDAILLFEILFR